MQVANLEAKLNGLNRRIVQLDELSARLIQRAVDLKLAEDKRRVAAELRQVERRIAELKQQAAVIQRLIALAAAERKRPTGDRHA